MSDIVFVTAAASNPGAEAVAVGGATWVRVAPAQGTHEMTREQSQQLSNDIRQTVREQIQAAQVQAQVAREAARAQAEAIRAHQEAGLPQGLPAPPAPSAPEVVRIDRNGKVVTIRTGDGGTTVAGQGTPPEIPDLPHSIVTVALAFFLMLAFITVGWPLARAFARRMDRQSAGGRASGFPADVSDRIERIEHAVEAIAIEVERISEGQRFTTRLLSEMRPDALPAGAASGAPPSDRRP